MRVSRFRLLVFGSIASAVAMACGLELSGELPDTFIDRQDGAPDVVDATAPPSRGVVDISAGYSMTCAAMIEGPPRCWGANDAGQLGSGITGAGNPELSPSAAPRIVAMTERAISISAGGFGDGVPERPFACALGESGNVWCWGDDTWGQSGRGDAGPSPPSVPARVVNLPQDIREVHVGGSHACAAIDGEFNLYCWGRSHLGQNQTIAEADRTPFKVPTRAPVRSFSTGNYHTCAILADGTIDCWGLNTYAELGHAGTGPEVDASVVPGVANAQVVRAGHVHTCAVHGEGKVSCFGHNVQLQLGREPSALSGLPDLVPLPNDAGAIDVCAGFIHSCAVLTDNTAVCWGNNLWGQLGDGTDDAGNQSAPVRVVDLRDVVKISCGGGHTCALDKSGNVHCWGSNEHGQLGRGDAGDPSRHARPAPVVF